jgi:hypothetical protein
MGTRIKSTGVGRVGLVALLLTALVAAGCTIVVYPSPGRTVDPSNPLTTSVPAHPIGTFTLPAEPLVGEGKLQLQMSAPGTSWVDAANTSVVVEVAIDGGAPQSFVLFAGAAPHVYAGFTGPLSTGSHDVAVSVRPDLSVTTGTPTVLVQSLELVVIPPTDPGYAALAHAPVLYGRGVNAHSDTPLFGYAESTPQGDGIRVEYTTTWSNEDAGTGAAPILLWGGYGRTTDIETTAIVNLDASGDVTSATYQTCAACPADYPENQVGLDHSYVTFAGTYFGGHPILRVATGNNVLKDTGTTAFRFQQGLATAPLAGETRESAMDPFALGYRVMGEEIQREQAGYTTNPLSSAPGDARQYAIVDLDTSPVGTKAVGVELRIAGDTHWYANDFGLGGTVFYRGGHSRTGVKLPLDWHGKAITAARVRLYPTIPAPVTPPSITVQSFRVLEVKSDYATAYRSVPAPSVVLNP